MASTFCCGFECGTGTGHSAASPFIIAWTLTGAAAFSTVSPIRGARCLLVNPSASATGTAFGHVDTASSNIHVMRVRLVFDTLPNLNCGLVTTSATGLPGAHFNASDNKIYAGITGSFGATGVDVTTGVVYWVDVRVDSSANPWLIDVQVNGQACGQKSNAVAAAGSNINRFGLQWSGSMTAAIRFDDVKLSQTAADYPFGDGYVDCFVPTADGTHNILAANRFERSLTGTDITNATTDANALVAKQPLAGGVPSVFVNLIAPTATEYVELIFGPAASGGSTPLAPPRAVEVLTGCAALNTNTCNLQLALNDNGSLNDVRNATIGSTSVISNSKHYTDPPSAATVWTLVSGNGNFNNLRMRCLSSDANPDPYWVHAMIEAEFPPLTRKPATLFGNQTINRAATF